MRSVNKTPNRRSNSCNKKAREVVHIPNSKGVRLRDTLSMFVSSDAKSKASNKSKLFKMSPTESKTGNKQLLVIQKSAVDTLASFGTG